MSSIETRGTRSMVMVTVKKLSMLIAGAGISGFCLGLEPAHADHGFLQDTEPNGENTSDGLLKYQDSSQGLGYGVFLSSPPSLDSDNFRPLNNVPSKYTDGQYEILEGFVPTLTGPSPHIHFKDTEGFFVVNGRAAFLRGDQTFVGNPGNLTFVPTNTLHNWLNLEEKPGDFRLLLITTPPTVDYILQLGAQGTDEYYVNSVKLDSGYATKVVDSLLFSNFEYKLKQDGTPIVPVTVRRVGDTEEPASATIALSGGTAVLGEDYSTTEIPINFGPQETTQTLEVPIPLIDNDLSEGNTTLELTLTNPTDGTIIAPLQSKALLTIVDENAPLNGDNENAPLKGENRDSFSRWQELYNLPVLSPSSQVIDPFRLGGGTATVVATGEDTGGFYSLLDVLVPPQTELQSDINYQENQGLYILDGNLSFELDDQAITATPGSFVYLSKDQPYKFGNLETTPARLLLISTPPTSVPETSSCLGILGFGAYVGASLVLKRKQKKQKSATFESQRIVA